MRNECLIDDIAIAYPIDRPANFDDARSVTRVQFPLRGMKGESLSLGLNACRGLSARVLASLFGELP